MPNAAADRHGEADRPAPVGFAPRAGRGGLNKNAPKRGREVRTAARELGMRYFVTVATGFMRKRLVKALLARRDAVVYFLTKHESEKIVRTESKVPWTVYRPALVVGDSQTGEMDKIDGPYYFFKLIQRMRQLLPPWMPSIGLEGGRINIVPVDFVVAALDHISHLKTDLDKRCFHLVDPLGYRVGDVLDIISKAAHAPKTNLFVNAALLGFIPKRVKKGLMAIAPVRRVKAAVLKDLGLPEDMLTFVNFPTRYDCRETLAALKGSGVECPRLDGYAWRLWDY